MIEHHPRKSYCGEEGYGDAYGEGLCKPLYRTGTEYPKCNGSDQRSDV